MIIVIFNKVSTAQAGPFVILVNFLSQPLCVAANVLKAHPMVSPVVDLTDVHIFKRGHICFRSEARIKEANFTACTPNGRAGYRVNFFRCEVSLFEDRECQIFYGHGRKVNRVFFLLVGFLIRIIGGLGFDSSPVIYGDCFQVIEVNSLLTAPHALRERALCFL